MYLLKIKTMFAKKPHEPPCDNSIDISLKVVVNNEVQYLLVLFFAERHFTAVDAHSNNRRTNLSSAVWAAIGEWRCFVTVSVTIWWSSLVLSGTNNLKLFPMTRQKKWFTLHFDKKLLLPLIIHRPLSHGKKFYIVGAWVRSFGVDLQHHFRNPPNQSFSFSVPLQQLNL